MKVDLTEASRMLSRGQLVAIPTETVYGLAAPINQQDSLEMIFKLKRRPFFDPLIVHISDLEELWPLISEEARESQNWRLLITTLAQKFWPGPLTLILPKSALVSDLITSGLDTVGIRIPNHPLTIELLKKISTPLAAPSANLFGKTSPTLAEHVEAEFPDLGVLDGGPCSIGVESTILKISTVDPNALHFNLEILRPGMLKKDDISTKMSEFSQMSGSRFSWKEKTKVFDRIEAPGQVKHHYMPQKPILLLNQLSDLDLALKKIQLRVSPDEGWLIPLGVSPELAARNLYAKMRELDLRDEKFGIILGWKKLASDEAWEAIADRLGRAATYAVTDL